MKICIFHSKHHGKTFHPPLGVENAGCCGFNDKHAQSLRAKLNSRVHSLHSKTVRVDLERSEILRHWTTVDVVHQSQLSTAERSSGKRSKLRPWLAYLICWAMMGERL